MAQRHYKDLKLGESTVRYFKKKNLEELSKRVKGVCIFTYNIVLYCYNRNFFDYKYL